MLVSDFLFKNIEFWMVVSDDSGGSFLGDRRFFRFLDRCSTSFEKKTRHVRSSSFSLFFCVSLFICGARLCFGLSFSRKM